MPSICHLNLKQKKLWASDFEGKYVIHMYMEKSNCSLSFVLGLMDTPTFEGHSVSSLRKGEEK